VHLLVSEQYIDSIIHGAMIKVPKVLCFKMFENVEYRNLLLLV